ncbi:putative RNA-directed DNA polymerase from transposon BS [Trichonephila clavipes]|nr:putative RNA-directed DNA polymerase from transposon BS [Trichonephila clavipes]
MDDKATCHRTLAVQDCLDSVWPGRSPDLNPIENVWDALGRQVAGRNYTPTNKNTLICALTEEWDKLPQQLLYNVVQISFSFFQGVPQSSVLSPTLFSLFLSGIDSVIKRKRDFGAFADDIVLWKSDSDLMKLERDINLIFEDIRNFTLDHKLTFNHTKFVARKRLNILSYIFGCDCGADAGTLRNTYITLIRLIFEYGVPVYCSASVTNFQKLEKVQLSAFRIITGLKNTCPRDIVLFEVDLHPFSLRRRACLTKYYNKHRCLDSRNRTSAYFKDWCNNQILGRNSPFSQMASFYLTIGAVEPHHLPQCLDSVDYLDGVFFHPESLVHVNK